MSSSGDRPAEPSSLDWRVLEPTYTRLERFYLSVEYIIREDVRCLQHIVGLPIAMEEQAIAQKLCQGFAVSLMLGAVAEMEMPGREKITAAHGIFAAARSLLKSLGYPDDPAELSIGQSYQAAEYPSATSQTLLLSEWLHVQSLMILMARLWPTEKSDSDPPLLSIAAAATPYLARMRTNAAFSGSREQDLSNYLNVIHTLVNIAPYAAAAALEVSRSFMQLSHTAKRPAKRSKNNFDREFRQVFFDLAARSYLEMFGTKLQTADELRRPDGPATRWAIRLLEIGLKRFDAVIPTLRMAASPNDRRLLDRAGICLRRASQLKPGTIAARLNNPRGSPAKS